MKSETIASKMLEQTCNLMSSGGGSFEALTAGDIQGLLRSIEATPLIWSFFEAKYQIQPKQQFTDKMYFWMYNRLLNQKDLKPEYIVKNHISAVNAAHELSHGLSSYLARHKVMNESLSPWFRSLKVGKHQFNRKYAPFIRECIADLEAQLGKLERKIHARTQND